MFRNCPKLDAFFWVFLLFFGDFGPLEPSTSCKKRDRQILFASGTNFLELFMKMYSKLLYVQYWRRKPRPYYVFFPKKTVGSKFIFLNNNWTMIYYISFESSWFTDFKNFIKFTPKGIYPTQGGFWRSTLLQSTLTMSTASQTLCRKYIYTYSEAQFNTLQIKKKVIVLL